MNKYNILYGIIGLLAGFIIGFVFANQTNRNALNNGARTAQTNSSRSNAQAVGESGGAEQTSANSNRPPTPSEAEIREAIAKADARPDDAALQRNFGMVLYRYASQTQNASFLPDVARMLKRALDANPQDRDLNIALGNVLFDIGQASDPARFAEAREYYLKALEIKADDVNVRTDLGLTYYFGQPSDPQRAITEYRKSLALDPRHEPTLQNLATALIATGKLEEAQKIIDQLASLNPTNPSLPDLRAQMAQGRNKTRE